jgi:heat shock protein HtpX
MFFLQLRMWMLMSALFGIVYAIVVMIGTYAGISNFYIYLVISFVIMFIQYMLGPKIVEWQMKVRYVNKDTEPRLYQVVEDLARKAKIPMPKVGIAQVELPNAFAFGRSIKDGRVCLTQGIMRLLDENELRAVLGHEVSHLKNRDFLTITLLSVIPMIMYRIAWQFLFYGRRRDERSGGNTALIGLAALIFYFITNLLVLYASRIREYFADRGSLELGNSSSDMASSLYKLAYGSARVSQESLKSVEGLKAFFANDPSQARNDIKELRQLDLDRSGTIDASELARLTTIKVNIGLADKLMELLSTHPNMLKRIKQLSQYRS